MSTKRGLPVQIQPWHHCMYMHWSSATMFLILIASLFFAGCKKDEPRPDPSLPPAPTPAYQLKVLHHIDGVPLHFDSLMYVNEAGHEYSVTRLQYYLSGITLHGTGGTADHTVAGHFFMDGRGAASFDLSNIPTGTYGGASLLLGLPPELNITNALPNTLENAAMAWPDPMGGGYHFIKLEGHFMHGASISGYAMHMGKNEHLPHCVAPGAFVISSPPMKLVLSFNLNEVFRAPHTYDLSTGNYSMGSSALMALLRDNCADVFTIHVEP